MDISDKLSSCVGVKEEVVIFHFRSLILSAGTSFDNLTTPWGHLDSLFYFMNGPTHGVVLLVYSLMVIGCVNESLRVVEFVLCVVLYVYLCLAAVFQRQNAITMSCQIFFSSCHCIKYYIDGRFASVVAPKSEQPV